MLLLLLSLGEVRATHVVTTFVDGKQGHSNHEDTVIMIYLSISMGYHMCYKMYMVALRYNVWSKPNGTMMVEGAEGDLSILVSTLVLSRVIT